MPEYAIEMPTPWGTLAGTLQLPDDGEGPWPVALIIAGSGPTDRDGNNPLLAQPCDNLKRLAALLAAQGIASLRYDKRGVGGSTFPGLSESALRFEHLVGDAVSLARFLAGDERLGELVLVGHSEGALIAALAAQRVPARAVVAISGAAERASALMRSQIEERLPPELLPAALAALDALEAGREAPDVPDDLVLLFRPSVQPYLISWFRHDPAAVLAALALPVLVVHGTADEQVPPGHAERLQAAAPGLRLHLVDGMDHLLAIGDDTQRGIEAVAGEIARWLRSLPQPVSA